MIVGAVGYTSPNATAVVRLSPVANASGRTTITVTVSDDGGTALGGNDRFSISFLVEVTPVNDPPVVGAVTSQSMEEDTALSIPFTIGDVETDASALSVSGQSSNPGLLPPWKPRIFGKWCESDGHRDPLPGTRTVRQRSP